LTKQARQIDAVIFDLDDTLIDWAQPAMTWKEFTRPKYGNMYTYLVEAGHPLSDEERFCEVIHQYTQILWEEARLSWSGVSFANVLQRTLQELGLNPDEVDLDALMQTFDWGPLPGVVPFDDTLLVLQALRQRDYQIGLITNSFLPISMREAELDYYGLLGYLDVRIASGDSGYIKPHPAIFEQALARLKTTAERTVFVGDRPEHDIAGANEVGMISVLMTPPHLERPLNGVVPDFTIRRLAELLPILDELEAS
jgi:HAD superfamily hydrolase (TIGR01509 family)